MTDWVGILGYVLTPIASVFTWIVSRSKQKNDFLKELQSSINLLASENKKLMLEVLALRKENVELRSEVEELNRRLNNVKTITKYEKNNR